MNRDHKAYPWFQKQMSLEVAAACETAFDAGAKEIWVKDAHSSARNILPDMLPKGVRLIRGWSGHPYSMVQEIDNSFDALMMVGYHSRAGQGGNPLAHTMSSASIESMYINDRQTSEFFLHGNVAAKHKVPLVFLSGDAGLCTEAAETNDNITTHATLTGIGNSTISLQPAESIDGIRAGVKKALGGDLSKCLWEHPDQFAVRIRFMKQQRAFRASHYPGAEFEDPKMVRFSATNFDDVMRFLLFVV